MSARCPRCQGRMFRTRDTLGAEEWVCLPCGHVVYTKEPPTMPLVQATYENRKPPQPTPSGIHRGPNTGRTRHGGERS